MATQVSTVWSDIHHDIISDGSGQIKVSENVDAVRTSIDNILRTHQGERVMVRRFGFAFRGVLFEPMNSTALKYTTQGIISAIETWDDRVSVEDVEIRGDPDEQQVHVRLKLRIRGQSGIFEYQTTLGG